MTISYSFAVENGLMIVTAAGSDDSVQEVMDYGVAIIAAAVASNCTRVLCDERDLTIGWARSTHFNPHNILPNKRHALPAPRSSVNRRTIKMRRFGRRWR